MKTRLLALMAVLLLALALVPVVSAQDDPGCFGLSSEDCDLLDRATANTLSASSFFHEWSLDVTITGLDTVAALAPESGITGDIDLSVSGSGPLSFTPDIADVLQLQQTASYELIMGTDTQSGSAVLTVVDGVLYAELDGETVGMPLEEAIEEADPSVDANINPANLADLMEVEPTSLAIRGTSAGVPPSLAVFFNFERAGDEFVFTTDVGGLLNSEEFSALLPLVLALAGEELGDLGDTQDLVEQLPQFMAAIDSNITIIQSVDPVAELVTGFVFDIDFAFDLGMAAGAPGAFPPIVLEVTFATEMSQFNEAFAYTAPENAEMLEPGELPMDLPF